MAPSARVLLGFLVLVCGINSTQLAKAVEATSQSPESQPIGLNRETPEQSAQRRQTQREPITFDRHENGLDVKTTSLFRRQVSPSSPNILLGAQWNYRFHTDTFIGLGLNGMLTGSRAPTTDDSVLRYTTYSGGITLSQSLFASGAFRIVINVSGGVGVIYLRYNPYGTDQSIFEKPNYKFVEPGVFVTLFDVSGVQVGVMGSMRRAKLLGTASLVTDEDLTSKTIGLTFRTMRH